ncbi:hypothetical protein BDB00DRAFT_855235 [Zychaea mexicana]|uniref:uncharacterized protein n=1 Tax=Zychaea mexicana TaxID=64656 RepID=UPI0022FE6C35|nr:uncharacterized protein BDB00DRAFT_855235 [Zychaea mexicana]KAI9484499.1 hypothetical protein BDB00DRAFT_855235 [Zychaea mexicana]
MTFFVTRNQRNFSLAERVIGSFLLSQFVRALSVVRIRPLFCRNKVGLCCCLDFPVAVTTTFVIVPETLVIYTTEPDENNNNGSTLIKTPS